jgi:hypothetical protein
MVRAMVRAYFSNAHPGSGRYPDGAFGPLLLFRLPRSLDSFRPFCDISLQLMKLSSRNRSTFLTFLGLGFLVGTLGWEVLERIVLQMGFELALGVGPVGFDLSVLSVFVKINPGTFIGVLGGIFLFRVM